MASALHAPWGEARGLSPQVYLQLLRFPREHIKQCEVFLKVSTETLVIQETRHMVGRLWADIHDHYSNVLCLNLSDQIGTSDLPCGHNDGGDFCP